MNIDESALPQAFAEFVLGAMNSQRIRDAQLVRAFADQLPIDHPGKATALEISETLMNKAQTEIEKRLT